VYRAPLAVGQRRAVHESLAAVDLFNQDESVTLLGAHVPATDVDQLADTVGDLQFRVGIGRRSTRRHRHDRRRVRHAELVEYAARVLSTSLFRQALQRFRFVDRQSSLCWQRQLPLRILRNIPAERAL
jgi:hypothetical protein